MNNTSNEAAKFITYSLCAAVGGLMVGLIGGDAYFGHDTWSNILATSGVGILSAWASGVGTMLYLGLKTD